MKTYNFSKLANDAGYSRQYICNLLSGRQKPTYRIAKALAKVTSTDVMLWLEGSPDELRQMAMNYKKDGDL